MVVGWPYELPIQHPTLIPDNGLLARRAIHALFT